MQRNSMDYFLSFQWHKSQPDGGACIPSKLGQNKIVNIAIKLVNKTVIFFVCVNMGSVLLIHSHCVYFMRLDISKV